MITTILIALGLFTLFAFSVKVKRYSDYIEGLFPKDEEEENE